MAVVAQCYQRRLTIISETLELRVEGGQVSYSWCVCVVSHDSGMLGGAGMEVVDGVHAGQCQGVVHISRDAGALPACKVIHL